jgi:hypothetical protein
MRAGLRGLFAALRHRERKTLALREGTALSGRNLPWYPQAPKLQPDDFQLLQELRQELKYELEPGEVFTDHDILYFALQELACALRSPSREDEVLRLLFYVSERPQQPKSR